MSPTPPLLTMSKVSEPMIVFWDDSSSFSSACSATVGRWVMIGTRMVVPDEGTGRRLVDSMNGRAGSMTPRSSLMNASGMTPRLSVVISSLDGPGVELGLRDVLAGQHPQGDVRPHADVGLRASSPWTAGTVKSERYRSSIFSSRSRIFSSTPRIDSTARSNPEKSNAGAAGVSSWAAVTAASSSAIAASSSWDRTAKTRASA